MNLKQFNTKVIFKDNNYFYTRFNADNINDIISHYNGMAYYYFDENGIERAGDYVSSLEMVNIETGEIISHIY